MSRRASVNRRMSIHTQFISIITLFFAYQNVAGAQIIQGNSETDQTSFACAMHKHVQDHTNGRFFVAAAPHAGGAGKVKNFALSAISESEKTNLLSYRSHQKQCISI